MSRPILARAGANRPAALNSICLHAPKVARSTTRDKADFITFVLAWYESLHEHHEGEEKYYFTELEAVSAAGLMATNYAQHEAFHAGLAALHEYAKSVRATPDTFDAAHLLSIIDAFAPALTVHLHDEIPTLLELGRTHPHIDIRKIDETHAQRMVAGVNKFYFLPLFFSNHDRHFDGGKWQEGFPAVPHAVRVVTKWILYFPHRGAWRFSACTFDEELKPNMYVAPGLAVHARADDS